MTKEEFTAQAARLKSTWPTSFPDEKLKLIWTATYQLEIKWFERLVTDLIANNRQAPLPIEFVNAANIKRRQDVLRFPYRNEIRPHESSIFSKEETSEIFSMIRKRLSGQITYQELEQYEKMIKGTVENQNENEPERSA